MWPHQSIHYTRHHFPQYLPANSPEIHAFSISNFPVLMTRIREATTLDREKIRDVHMSAFAEEERELVSALAIDLLNEESHPETITLVAEVDDELVGHIAFSPVSLGKDAEQVGYILAPLAVKPGYQKSRIGSQLVEKGIALLSERDVGMLFVYGDPQYYGRFGFDADTASGYLPPFALQYPSGWLALALHDMDSAESPVTIGCVAPLMDPVLW